MKYDYNAKITFGLNEPFDLQYIKDFCTKNPGQKILVEVQNTKGMTSSQIKELDDNVRIRIAGGYDEERVKRNKNVKYVGGETGEYYYTAVIYSKNETVKILEKIEEIESYMNPSWSDPQIMTYIYNTLKKNIMYDPKNETKLSSETRSLRGLISSDTVCAGFSMIFKEFMDRNDIECEYVEGYTSIDKDTGKKSGAHAWNIVGFDGKKYPFDLTWDNTQYRSGKFNTFYYLGQDVKNFSASHIPYDEEKTQNYEQNLSELPSNLIKVIVEQINRQTDYKRSTYYGERKDGSKFLVAQIADKEINGQEYFRYYYRDLLPDGNMGDPLILYSETNLAHLIDCKKFNRPIADGYEEAIDNILFSKENIINSLNMGTYYIGRAEKPSSTNKDDFIKSVADITKSNKKTNLFKYPTRIYTRSDGSVIVVQKTKKNPYRFNKETLYRYDVFELVMENGQRVLKKNTIFTENGLFNINNQKMIDVFFSRERMEAMFKKASGYMGKYENGKVTYSPYFLQMFNSDSTILTPEEEEERRESERKKREEELNFNKSIFQRFNEKISYLTSMPKRAVEWLKGKINKDRAPSDNSKIHNFDMYVQMGLTKLKGKRIEGQIKAKKKIVDFEDDVAQKYTESKASVSKFFRQKKELLNELYFGYNVKFAMEDIYKDEADKHLDYRIVNRAVNFKNDSVQFVKNKFGKICTLSKKILSPVTKRFNSLRDFLSKDVSRQELEEAIDTMRRNNAEKLDELHGMRRTRRAGYISIITFSLMGFIMLSVAIFIIIGKMLGKL